jgi:hypothetical protein
MIIYDKISLLFFHKYFILLLHYMFALTRLHNLSQVCAVSASARINIRCPVE